MALNSLNISGNYSNLMYGRCGVVVKTLARESVEPVLESRLTVHWNCQRLLNAFVIECYWE